MTFIKSTRGASTRRLHVWVRAVVIASALALPMGVASAQTASTPSSTPAALQAAGEIIRLTGAAELFTPIVPGVIEQSKQFFIQQNPLMSSDANEVALQLRKEYDSRTADVNAKVVEIYASHFTEAELKDILAFYTSAAGKKLLAEQPKFVDESLKYGQEWANSLSDEVIAKMREGLKKKGHKL